MGSAARPSTAPAFSFLLSPSSFFWALAALITLVSLLLQVGGLSHQAVIDDHGWLHDPVYRGCDRSAWECFKHPQLYYYYRPLVAVSFVLGLRLHPIAATVLPGEARPFHVENLLMHGLAVLLVFWLFGLLFEHRRSALLGGLLFALHPLNVPVTTFIGGRTDNLALICLMLWAIGLVKGQKYWLWRILSLLAFGGALFAKEQCYLLLLLAPLLASWHEGKAEGERKKERNRQDWRKWVWLAWFAVPAFAHLWCWRRVGQTTRAEDLAGHGVARSFFSQAYWPLGLHLEMIGRTCWYYLCCFLFPTVSRMHQSTLGPWDCRALGPKGCTTPGVPLPPSLWLAVGGGVALVFALWLGWRTWHLRACRFCLLWVGLTLLPCLNIIPVPSQFIAPYRALIPLVGVCGLAGALLEPCFAVPSRLSKQMWAAGGVALVGACLALTSLTLADVAWWKDDGTLMQAEMAADLNFVPARTGVAYLHELNGEVEEAIGSYDIAVRQLLPETAGAAHPADAIIRAERAGDLPRRVESASSLRYNDLPYLANMLLTRGGLNQRLARWNDAAEDYRAAYALLPQNDSLGDWLAYALDHAGRRNEAETVLKAQIARRADAYRLSQLGSLYFRAGRWTAARDTLAQALQAPASSTGATMDTLLAQQQYRQASLHLLSKNLNNKTTTKP